MGISNVERLQKKYEEMRKAVDIRRVEMKESLTEEECIFFDMLEFFTKASKQQVKTKIIKKWFMDNRGVIDKIENSVLGYSDGKQVGKHLIEMNRGFDALLEDLKIKKDKVEAMRTGE